MTRYTIRITNSEGRIVSQEVVRLALDNIEPYAQKALGATNSGVKATINPVGKDAKLIWVVERNA